MVIRVFPSLPYDWVEQMDEDELFGWFQKAIEFHAKETMTLVKASNDGIYESPYEFKE